MELTAEQLNSNYKELMSYIGKYITGERKDKLVKFYKKYEERIILLPAAHKEAYHSSFPGGYVYHVNNVIKNAIVSFDVWKRAGSDLGDLTLENVVFCALNHDLGKVGTMDEVSVFPSQDQWRKKNLGENYTFNTKIAYMTVPDRSLFLLSQMGISMTEDEWIAIRVHDGLFDDANKAYYKSFIPENKFRTPLALIIHEADMRAARIEFEQQYLPKIIKNSLEGEKKSRNLAPTQKTQAKALASKSSEGLKSMLDNL